MGSPSFPLESDLDFYCFLKLNLPAGWEIVAEPHKNYYSEWQFCYRVYRNHELLKTYEGDFRDVPKGSLIQTAADLLATIEKATKC
jgi:hypothetical protein